MKPGELLKFPFLMTNFPEVDPHDRWNYMGIKTNDVLLCVEEMKVSLKTFPELGFMILEEPKQTKLEKFISIIMPLLVVLNFSCGFQTLLAGNLIFGTILSILWITIGALQWLVYSDKRKEKKSELRRWLSYVVLRIKFPRPGELDYKKKDYKVAAKEFEETKQFKGFKFLCPDGNSYVWISNYDIADIVNYDKAKKS